MKRYLVISIILHLILIAVAFFLISQTEKESKPFVTTIVTPEELAPAKQPPPPPKQKKQHENRYVKNVRTNETNVPNKLFAVPKGSASNKDKLPGKEANKDAAVPSRSGTHLSTESKPKETPMREKLFDRAVIGKTALASRARTARSVKSGGVSFDIGQGRYYGWLQRVSEKLAAVWKYPHELVERRIFGDVDVRITFKKNGELGRVELVSTSGYRVLDDSVIRALNDANPYWPLPDDWEEDELTIIGHFMSK